MRLTLAQKQKEITKYVKKWKRLLSLSDYRHKTRYVNGSDRKDKMVKECIMYIQINEPDKFFHITVNNSEIKAMSLASIENTVIHELAHCFFSGIYDLFWAEIQQFNKEIREVLNKKFDELEHKKIYQLIRVFKKLKKLENEDNVQKA